MRRSFGSKGQHHLPRVPRLRHEAEGRFCRRIRKNPVGQRRQLAGLEQAHHGVQQALHHLRAIDPHPVEVYGKIGQVVAERSQIQRAVLVDVALADLHEFAVGTQAAQAAPDGLARQRVQDDADAPAASGRQHFLGKIQRAGIHDMRRPQCPQEFAFFGRSGSGVHGGPGTPTQRDGRQAHATRRRMNQDAVVRPHLAEGVQRVIGRQVRNRQGRGSLTAQMAGATNHES